MPVQTEIAFDQLIQIAKELPPQQWEKLKKEVESNSLKDEERETFRKMLLDGPVFSEEQLLDMGENRKRINKWKMK